MPLERIKCGDSVQYDDPYYGKGNGIVCGYKRIMGDEYYAVYPKVVVKKDDYLAYIIPAKNLIEVPF